MPRPFGDDPAMRYAPLLIVLLATFSFAQTTQPSTQPTSQPTVADRTTPLGMCVLLDKTAADLTVEQAMEFFHCTTNAHRRLARSESEFYISVNKLVRVVIKLHGAESGKKIREMFNDSDDYSDATINEEGNSAAMQRPGQTPYPMIKIDGKWHYSMPDWFEIVGAESIYEERVQFEELADQADDLRKKIEAGELKSIGAIEGEAEKLLGME